MSKEVLKGILWTVLRLWLGYEWIVAGWHKVSDPKGLWVGPNAGGAVAGFLKGAIAKSKAAPGQVPEVKEWYASFLQSFALPNAKAFSVLVAYGELLVGLALIVGLLTTFALYMGLLMNLNYLLAGTSSTNPQMLVVEMILLFVGASAVSYGVDRYLMPWLKKKYRKDGSGPQTA